MKTKAFILALSAFTLLSFAPTNQILNATNYTKTKAEKRTVKGVVSNSKGPLAQVSIILKGAKVGTTTNKNGEFTFPQQLQDGDVLVFTFLGYQNQEVTIEANTTFITLTMQEEVIEIAGDLATDQPYQSKRKRN